MATTRSNLSGTGPTPSTPQNCDVYTLFIDTTDTTRGLRQADSDRLPRIPVPPRPDSRRAPNRQSRGPVMVTAGQPRQVSDESEQPFNAGFCRQLAAMYTDVGMSTVERVRWLCGWMVLVYALTCCAWFAWPTYAVPAVGVITGIVGLLASQRPHDPNYLSYVTAFLMLNCTQLVLLVWILFVSLTAELSEGCTKGCAGVEAKAVFIVLLALATGTFHWRVVDITRCYLREFRMIEQLTMRGEDFYRLDDSFLHAGSSTMRTEVHSSSSVSSLLVSENAAAFAVPVVQAIPVRD